MSNHVTPSDIREDVSKGLRSGNGNDAGNGNSGSGGFTRLEARRSAKNLRNKSKISDEVLEREIRRSEQKLRDEFPNQFLSLDTDKEKKAIRYFTYIKTAFQSRPDSGPSSYSQARRYQYNDTQLEYWKEKMINGLKDI
jgi:hypothetical protein